MLERVKACLRHAFALGEPGHRFTQEETQIVDKVAGFIARRRLAAPAVLFINSSAPLNTLANQVLVFLQPFASCIFNEREYERFAAVLEHRNAADFLVARIEEAQRALLPARGGAQAAGE